MSTKAKPTRNEQYLTVVQAAQRLSVHPSTIRRWIDRGRLPAYRLGDKRIWIKAYDLAGLVSPRPPRQGEEERMVRTERLMIHLLSKEEQQQGLYAFKELERLRNELADRHGRLSPESWELLDESRDERTVELMSESEE